MKIGDFGLATAKTRWSGTPEDGCEQPFGSILWMVTCYFLLSVAAVVNFLFYFSRPSCFNYSLLIMCILASLHEYIAISASLLLPRRTFTHILRRDSMLEIGFLQVTCAKVRSSGEV